MPTVTRARSKKAVLNLIQLQDEILTTIVRFTFDPVPFQDHVAHIFGPKRRIFENQTLLALSLAHLKLSAIARSWLTNCVCLTARPELFAFDERHQTLLERYQSFSNAVYDRPHMLHEIQFAVFEEPVVHRDDDFLNVVYDHMAASTSLHTLLLDLRKPVRMTYRTLLNRRPEAFANLQTLIHSNMRGGTVEDALRLCLFPNLRYLAVDIGDVLEDHDLDISEDQSDIDPDGFDSGDEPQNEKTLQNLKAVTNSNNFAKKLSTFKCFISGDDLPISMFKVLLPCAVCLTTITVDIRSLLDNRKLKHVKSLLKVFQLEAKQLVNLSLSATNIKGRNDLARLDFAFLGRLRTLAVSSVLIFSKAKYDNDRRPMYDPNIYHRLPPNIEELHITFNSAQGLVRNVHDSFLDILHGKCKCISADDDWSRWNAWGSRSCHPFDRTREANFKVYWRELLLDIQNACESMTWLVNLIQQCKEGMFKHLKRVIAVEDNDQLRSISMMSEFVPNIQSADEPGGIHSININRHGLCPWLEQTTLEIQLQAAIFSKLRNDAEVILSKVAADVPPKSKTMRESPFKCAICHEDYIPGRHQYGYFGTFYFDRH